MILNFLAALLALALLVWPAVTTPDPSLFYYGAGVGILFYYAVVPLLLGVIGDDEPGRPVQPAVKLPEAPRLYSKQERVTGRTDEQRAQDTLTTPKKESRKVIISDPAMVAEFWAVLAAHPLDPLQTYRLHVWCLNVTGADRALYRPVYTVSDSRYITVELVPSPIPSSP